MSLRIRLGQSLFLPGVCFAMAYLMASYQALLPRPFQSIFESGPYWLFAIVMILALILNRGRILLVGLLIVAALLSPQSAQADIFSQWFLTIIVPFNLFLILLLAERGPFTYQGILRLAFLMIQALGVSLWASGEFWTEGVLWASGGEQLADTAGLMALPGINGWPESFPIQLGFFVASLLTIMSVVMVAYKTSPINQGLLGAIIGYYLIFVLPLPSSLDPVFFLVVSLLLAYGLFRDYHNMAYQDELTGLPQRRALNEQMASLGRHYSIAMLDIDHFKKFNDTHGHDIGDEVLQLVASKIGKVTGSGRSYRFGGEEFTVVFSSKDAEHAAYHLEQVREAIENYEMVVREQERVKPADTYTKRSREKGSYSRASKTVSVTISIGVAEKTDRYERPEEVLKRADQALYKAKKAGRNQLKIAV